MNRDRRLLIILSVAFALFASVAFWGSRANMNALTEFFYLLAIAQLWNLLAGYAGLVSVGQQAWIGLGAYTLLVMTDDVGLPLIAALLVAESPPPPSSTQSGSDSLHTTPPPHAPSH